MQTESCKSEIDIVDFQSFPVARLYVYVYVFEGVGTAKELTVTRGARLRFWYTSVQTCKNTNIQINNNNRTNNQPISSINDPDDAINKPNNVINNGRIHYHSEQFAQSKVIADINNQCCNVATLLECRQMNALYRI